MNMERSKFLSKALGWYLLILSIGMLLKTPEFMAHVGALMQNTELLFVTGFFTLILGVLMVAGHNIWEWHWRVLITIIGWIALLKGVSILFYPEWLEPITKEWLNNVIFARTTATIDGVLGLILLIAGYKTK